MHIKKCSKCASILSKTTIPKAYVTVEDTVKLNKKGSKPKVSVTDVNGNKIDASNYTVAYAKNKKVGKASVTVTFKGNEYEGAVKKSFTVADAKDIPGKVTIKSTKPAKKKLTVSWGKVKNAKGYELQYSTDKNFLEDVKTVKISKADTLSKTISKLGAKTYYIRVRSTNKTKKYTAYSAWSKVKSVVVK